MSGSTGGFLFRRESTEIVLYVRRGRSVLSFVTWGGSIPLTVAGYSAKIVLKSKAGKVMLELSSNNGKAAIGGTDGLITFVGTPTDSRLVKSDGYWEILLTDPTGSVYTASAGRLISLREIA